jgi:hypothetical protein
MLVGQLLYDGQHVAVDFHDLDNNDDDELVCYYAFSWFETCRTTFDLLGKTLSLNDVVSDDKTT